MLGLVGLNSGSFVDVIHIALPLGISFYVFQCISYIIDIKRRQVEPLESLLDFACYVSMFPQLVAGPIVRLSEIKNELISRKVSSKKVGIGMKIFCVGLAKKVLLADTLAKIADLGFDSVSTLNTPTAWFVVLCYTLQIYYDFSGYSDMAIGLGKILGFTFPQNFNSPYISRSVTEFWRRWHISLSSWLRDYLYISLGGNRKGRFRTYINLVIVMALGGLWHGASWNFIVWGLLHGTMLAFERLTGVSKARGLTNAIGWCYTMIVVMIGWVFFRSATLYDSIEMLGKMFTVNFENGASQFMAALAFKPVYLISALIGCLLALFFKNSNQLKYEYSNVPYLFYFLVSVVLLVNRAYSPFIYYIF